MHGRIHLDAVFAKEFTRQFFVEQAGDLVASLGCEQRVGDGVAGRFLAFDELFAQLIPDGVEHESWGGVHLHSIYLRLTTCLIARACARQCQQGQH